MMNGSGPRFHPQKVESMYRAVRPRVLVVDDDPDVRMFLAEELDEEGFDVTLLKNGLDALSEIPFNPFDLIVTDWKLPLRDGLKILQTVKEIHPDVPVVLMTAFPDSKIRRKVEKNGSVFVEKPFSMDAFKKLLFSLLPE